MDPWSAQEGATLYLNSTVGPTQVKEAKQPKSTCAFTAGGNSKTFSEEKGFFFLVPFHALKEA